MRSRGRSRSPQADRGVGWRAASRLATFRHAQTFAAVTALPTQPRRSLPDELRTARVRLRRPRDTDAQALFTNWSSDAAVVRYLPWPRHEDVSHASAYITSLQSRWADGTAFAWMLTTPPDDECVGLGLIRFHEDDAEIGYSLARACWGRGYMPEVCRELLRHAFALPGVRRAVAIVDTENTPSIRVLEKIGMRCIDTFTGDTVHPNISDSPRPCYLFAIDRSEWSRLAL